MSDVSRHRYTIPRARGEGAQILYTALSRVNYRANEISSAILRVQLAKMDTIIRRIREIKSKIKKGISDIPGLSFRRIPDPEGEVAVGLVFFTESKDKAILFKEALMAENIRTPSG